MSVIGFGIGLLMTCLFGQVPDRKTAQKYSNMLCWLNIKRKNCQDGSRQFGPANIAKAFFAINSIKMA
jgi:hypothetical protein